MCVNYATTSLFISHEIARKLSIFIDFSLFLRRRRCDDVFFDFAAGNRNSERQKKVKEWLTTPSSNFLWDQLKQVLQIGGNL